MTQPDQAKPDWAALPLAEKVSMLAGDGVWTVPGIPAAHLAGLRLVDGPNGAKMPAGSGVCVPCATSLAATWDPALVEQVGAALGRATRRVGAQMLLGPTVNLHRNPLGGRNFECFSEDPYLTSEIAVAYIMGVQSQGVAACVKHLICNDSEYERFTISAQVTEVVLRSLYLAPFAAAVRRAGVWAVMAAYNRLNGTYASEHTWLLTDVLRGELGFDGVVVSDWGATHSTEVALHAGLDIEMPGPAQHRGERLVAAVREGRVRRAALDAAFSRVAKLVERVTQPQSRPDPAATDSSLLRRAAGRGVVLLKNDGGLLPLRPAGLRTLALIGPFADRGQIQGGGSAHVADAPEPPILEALRNRMGREVTVRFERGVVLDDAPVPLSPPLLGGRSARVSYYAAGDVSAQPDLTEEISLISLGWHDSPGAGLDHRRMGIRVDARLRATETGTHQLRLVSDRPAELRLDGATIATTQPEEEGSQGWPAGQAARVDIDLQSGQDHTLTVTRPGTPADPAPPGLTFLSLAVVPPNPPDLLDRACALAGQADAAIVLVGLTPVHETEGRDRADMQLPGEQNVLVERVAAANPRTIVVLNSGSPVELPWVHQVPTLLQLWYPGREIGHVLADVLTGDVNPAGKLPTTWHARAADYPSWPFYPGADGLVEYGEGLLMGYRAGHRTRVPLFCFGHGMSYTTFHLEQPEIVTGPGGEASEFQINVPVTNTGKWAGREVIQVYAELGANHPELPAMELKGFAGVELAPGQTGLARIQLRAAELARWRGGGWQLPAGRVCLRIGTSAGDTPIRASITLPHTAGSASSPAPNGVSWHTA